MSPSKPTPIYCREVSAHLDLLLMAWSAEQCSDVDVPETKHWWNYFIGNEEAKVDTKVIARYLLEAIDDFIKIVHDKMGEVLPNKATILFSLATLYDATVTLPLLIRPFSGMVKNLLVNIVASTIIDYFCQKYESGEWGKIGE